MVDTPKLEHFSSSQTFRQFLRFDLFQAIVVQAFKY